MESPALRNLRGWCLRKPKPVRIRVNTDDGARDVTCTGPCWQHVAQTILALEPESCEALDDENNVIRVVQMAAIREDSDDFSPASVPPPPTAAPDPTANLAQLDAETARFTLFARLLSESYRHANETVAGAYRHSIETAFARLTDICEIMGRRGEALEKSLAATERLLRKAWEENIDLQATTQTAAGAGGVGDLGEAMADMFVRQAVAGA